jgi:DNA mismatch repair protein MutS
MLNDNTTLKDLSVFASGQDIFELLDNTTTDAGRIRLRKHIQHPPDSFDSLVNLQAAVLFFSENLELWPPEISNGTLVMLEKFFESADTISAPPGRTTIIMGEFFQKLLNRSEYFFTKFSLSHLSDFFNGCQKLVAILELPGVPARLRTVLEEIQSELSIHTLTKDVMRAGDKTPYKEMARLSYRARRELKHVAYRLVDHYSLLDAWRSMAAATVKNRWSFPDLRPSYPVCMEASAMYHPLLKTPVPYDIRFNADNHFLVLTGANMSGKTTFLRTLGVNALLAHLGMGVPADSYTASFLQGIITNMHVEDNILLGESFFFAEVQRIKQTALRLAEPLPHLILMDELFKGTNVHDAYECTRAVLEGLLLHRNHIMILSTHLYEVAQQFKDRPDMQFSYFVTRLTEEGNYSFSYELKKGISDDRIGYRILQKEGVIDLLWKKGEA